ncbi:Holliday junction branch migration protein RuvA [Arthrobacter sp. JSM 101049]|uniref:Holliday junction branch migration protein RuvA n=1 Tax=Arthrobacter sp. JSM 101049 TaxID=929097 RepID=UPI003569B78E
MISSLNGEVTHVALNSAVVEVSGFGMLIQATPQTLSGLHIGRRALVHTSMVVREDSMTLFGFASPAEREVFEVLLSVAGIGPRLALAVLAVHGPEEVRVAVSDGDAKAFTRVPGIGPKSAQRILLELAGKLAPTGEATTTLPAAAEPAWKDQVLQALVGLGWSEKDAGKALEATAAAEPELAATGHVGDILKSVLRDLGRGATVGGR